MCVTEGDPLKASREASQRRWVPLVGRPHAPASVRQSLTRAITVGLTASREPSQQARSVTRTVAESLKASREASQQPNEWRASVTTALATPTLTQAGSRDLAARRRAAKAPKVTAECEHVTGAQRSMTRAQSTTVYGCATSARPATHAASKLRRRSAPPEHIRGDRTARAGTPPADSRTARAGTPPADSQSAHACCQCSGLRNARQT
jgi:hypothetical protein